ncbi:Bug family tripartite tricarboxylate transporter substrate binding protein [Variovorax sp. RT4R15]|uniref:Bug family tripartite tricarboxylate transporter substrate binding protein n=1 Tax=Variovorax sp. RT4R15 TaxID=3443737 RepID=UPI003F4787AD
MKSTIVLIALCASALHAGAQNYPAQQPIQVIVPFSAGGAVDGMARVFARSIATQLGAQVVVINKEGAGGTIGFWQVARAAPNGYTLAFGPSTPVTSGSILLKGPKYDTLTPVCQTHENVMTVVVSADSPIKSIQQLMQLAKADPGKIAYGTAGQGTVPHLSAEHFAQAAGLKFNSIAYRGDSPMLVDLIGGAIQFGVSSAAAAAANDKLRVLAVFAEQRQARYPDAPSFKELGIASLAPGLNGLWAPKGISPAIVDTLAKACEVAVQSTEFRDAAKTQSQHPAYLGSQQYLQRVGADFQTLEKTIRSLNLKAE